jgi:alkanesulfonate monooxygenase SsuD/methylene tetrahydromethanopterin reductase-like flavin-dependent oxidoreductase (luciferase family)
MKFYTFDETAYPGVPEHVGPETRLTNRFCDPVLAGQTYQEHFDEWAICEDLGFDGALVNEHHFTYFNINPSSTVLAAALIMRTRRMKVGVIGHVLPLRHPVQTAEEFAQLDVLSGGRFIGGIVRGVPQEYVSFNKVTAGWGIMVPPPGTGVRAAVEGPRVGGQPGAGSVR